MSESNLYKKIKNILLNKFTGVYSQRVECKSIGAGMPDLMIIKNDKIFLVELKFEAKAWINKKLKIRQSQILTFKKIPYSKMFCIFQVGKNYYLFDKENFPKLKDKIKFSAFEELSTIKTENLKNIFDHLFYESSNI